MRSVRFAEEVVRTRGRLEVLGRTYKRDDRGRFGSGVRDALASAGTTEEVGVAASAEAKRITGRDIPFDMDGLSPDIAREYSEGVLRGMERFPGANLTRVMTADHQGLGLTFPDGNGGYKIEFNPDGPGRGAKAERFFREDLADGLSARQTVYGDPMGIGMHEFGHVVVNSYELGPRVTAAADRFAKSRNMDWDEAAEHYISAYAGERRGETAAEAFADVMLRGDAASPMSREIFDAIEAGAGP